MRIGILGGSFNPIHNGHLEIAKRILLSKAVENIWFLPSADHPFKKSTICLAFELRLQLVKKAITDMPCCFAFDYDRQGDEPSFTALLLKKLALRFPDDEFHFIIGHDILPELERWFNYLWLRDNAHFIIINRPGDYDLNTASVLKNKQFIEMQPQHVSSTQIRKQLAEGKNISGLVPAQIEPDIIKLYSI
jgi:nicotinate-nucleotide adenylyltransferase